jgi:hypothetical protein
VIEADLIGIDRDQLRAAIATQTPLAFRHRIADEPLLELDTLASTAAQMPPGWLLAQRACKEFVCDVAQPKPDGSPADVVRNLADNDCTMRLYHLELVGPYRDLGRRLIDGVERRVADVEGGITDHSDSAFLASVGAITPVHTDRHHNLLLQVTGIKDVFIGTFPDPERSQREIERSFWTESLMPTELPPDVTTFRMGPGDGVYVPPYAFHWTTVLDGPSVALSAGWSTAGTDRTELVIGVNKSLRRLGLRPRPPGQRRRTDRGKVGVATAVQRLRSIRSRRRAAATVTPRIPRAAEVKR